MNELLKLMKDTARYDVRDLALLLNEEEEKVSEEIRRLEEEKVIPGSGVSVTDLRQGGIHPESYRKGYAGGQPFSGTQAGSDRRCQRYGDDVHPQGIQNEQRCFL